MDPDHIMACPGGGGGKCKGKGKGGKVEWTGGGPICAHAGCDQHGELKCARCRAVLYCSQEHQRLHWKEGGHKRRCTPAPKAAAPAAAPPPPTPAAYLGVPVGGAETGGDNQPPTPAVAAPAAGPRKLCGACRVPKPVEAFSNSQLKKKARRRCLECFEAGRLDAEVEARGDPVNP